MKTITLPKPNATGKTSLEETLRRRRSIREYSPEPLTLEQISQLLWAANGITKGGFYRTYPSAGALYPLEVYAVVENVESLEAGIYHYLTKKHKIECVAKGKYLPVLYDYSWEQSALRECAAAFIITGVLSRTAKKYGSRAEQYVLQETGHCGQNILLQAAALGLGAAPMGAFKEERIRKECKLEGTPYYLIPVGKLR